jgi:uncharacterized protein
MRDVAPSGLGATTLFAVWMAVAAGLHAWPSASQSSPPKRLLAWADVRFGYQHDVISHALATIERLGYESGAFQTYIRTDSQPITKKPIRFPSNTGIAAGENLLARNLRDFDAIFFFGVREIDLSPDQRTDLMSFIKEDGKGFIAAHSGATAFMSWPEFGEMLGGRFDQHPWNVTEAKIIVEDPHFPAMKAFPASLLLRDEHYQLKDFSRNAVRVLARLDPASVDLAAPLVRRTDKDFPVAWAKMYGNGRVFYSTLGHLPEVWDTPAVRTMYFEAIRWALRLTDADASPSSR